MALLEKTTNATLQSQANMLHCTWLGETLTELLEHRTHVPVLRQEKQYLTRRSCNVLELLEKS
eukprot:3046580-Lingulodinium_polyedra.AAC.1